MNESAHQIAACFYFTGRSYTNPECAQAESIAGHISSDQCGPTTAAKRPDADRF